MKLILASTLIFFTLLADSSTTVELYKKQARDNNASAMFNLGLLYFSGDEVEQDYRLAFDWYQRAVQAGDLKALNNLA
ncbi:MAG: hypothetical protein PHG10_10415, partial [Sulfurimonas sp.]|nr:hypothetical protein [Sulfurimonas sp.]